MKAKDIFRILRILRYVMLSFTSVYFLENRNGCWQTRELLLILPLFGIQQLASIAGFFRYPECFKFAKR